MLPVHVSRSAPLMMALALAFPALLHAASATDLPDIRHEVRAGDTLEGVAKKYLKDPQQWREVGRINQVPNPTRLPIGSVIVIPASMVGYQNVTVEHVQGAAQLRSVLDSSRWQALTQGSVLTEGDELQVPANSFVTLKFADGSAVRITENSQIKLSELRKNGRTNDQHSVLQLDKGGIESSVVPAIEQRRKRKFEIKTPMATTSVRGTQFSVSISESGQALTSVDTGTVAVDGSQRSQTAVVHAGSGIAVQQDGRVGSVVAQLQPPSLQNNPAVFEDADFLTLRLGAVADAQKYQVLLARDAALHQVLRSQTFANTTAKFEAVEDGSYYISARALDGQNIPGKPNVQAIKVKATPVPPLYQSPQPGGLIGLSDGELVCIEGGQGIVAYRVQVAADAGFAKPLQDSNQLTACKTALQPVPAGDYFWRTASIRKLADGSLDQGPFSKPQAFKAGVNPGTLGADALSASESSNPSQLQLAWPSEAGQTFTLQLAQNEQFDKPLSSVQLDQSRWTSDALTPGDYFVRIQVQDPSGLKSRFSAPRKLTVEPAILTGSGAVLKSNDGKLVQSPQ